METTPTTVRAPKPPTKQSQRRRRSKRRSCREQFEILKAAVAGLLLALLATVLMGVATFVVYGEWQSDVALEEDGLVVEGRVTNVRYERSGREGDRIFLEYEFEHTPADGDPRTYTNEVRVESSEDALLEPGDPVPIRYAPDDPTVSRLASQHPNIFAAIALGGLFVVIGLVFGGLGLLQGLGGVLMLTGLIEESATHR